MDLASLLQSATEIAIASGDEIMGVYGGEIEVQEKLDHSPLTEADLLSHQLICNRLRELTPELPILSEESAATPWEERRHWKQFWLVDPLDGTKEFIKRNGEFTVNIALIESGDPILGVVHAPALRKTYAAYRGGGTPYRPLPYDERVLKVVASRSYASAETQGFLQRLECEIETLSIGSSLKICLVAEGAAHLYPRLGPTMEWDTAAAHAIALAAGVDVSDLAGNPLTYNKPDLHNPPFVVGAPSLRRLWLL